VTEVYQTQGGLDKFLGIIGQIEKILGRLPPNSIGVGSCISWAKFISEGAGERWEKGPGLAADTNWLRSLMGDFLPGNHCGPHLAAQAETVASRQEKLWIPGERDRILLAAQKAARMERFRRSKRPR
jgi:hypothetical protein